MKFEHALPALRAGYVIGIHYPDDIVFTWYSKCKVHPRDVYVHSFSRPKDLIAQFPSADVLRDDWIVGVEVYPEPVEGVWSNNIPLWFAIEGEPTIEELKEKAEAALAAREERLQG